MCVCWIVSATGPPDQETKTARRSLCFSKVIENANKDISTSEYVDEVKLPNVCIKLVLSRFTYFWFLFFVNKCYFQILHDLFLTLNLILF